MQRRKQNDHQYGTCRRCGKYTNEWWYFRHEDNSCECKACNTDLYKGKQLNFLGEEEQPPVLTNRGGSSTTPKRKNKKVLPLWKKELNRMLGG